jgi:two-component system CheB/CheR fusion protein
MAREGLKVFLISTLRNITPDSEAVTRVLTLRREKGMADVRVTVNPIPKKEGEGLYIASFEEIVRERKQDRKSKKGRYKDNETRGLMEELESVKERLSTTVEELEVSNEQLRATNQEYLSTNDELYASKEELQSLNEELEMVNSELKAKVQQIETSYDSIHSMLKSLDIPLIFLDHSLHIRRFSSNVDRIVEMIESDVGRPLSQLASKVADVDLEKESRKVLESRKHVKRQVKTKEKHSYLMRILPYRMDNQQTGVVLTFMLNLHSDIEIIGEASDGEEAVEKARSLQPDVILMDIRMPKMDGIEATRIIKSERPDMRVIGLSMHDKEASAMIEAGASDYYTKDGDTDTLLSIIGGETRRFSSTREMI